MKIVLDTNVLISGLFWGGKPRRVIHAVVTAEVQAAATREIIAEYHRIVMEMIENKHKTLDAEIFNSFLDILDLTPVTSTTDICRDPDDNKFLSCAKDAKALFVVSGDNDLLSLEKFEDVRIITAQQFCAEYLS